MSSYLQQVSNGRKPQGSRIVFYAQEKMGKTTLASGAPGALLIPLEVGYESVNVMKTPMIQTWDELMALQNEIFVQAQSGNFAKTLIYDSGTAMERMIHEKIIQTDPGYQRGNTRSVTMESALGGYGKAYQRANEMFSEFLKQCDQLAVFGNINIIITCHSFAAKVVDPQSGEYDSWDILLHSPKNNKTYGKREIIKQWADVIGFLYEPMYVMKGEDKVSKGVSKGQGRVLGLSPTPAYVAGNRYNVVGEISIPQQNGWNYFAKAVHDSSGVDLYTR